MRAKPKLSLTFLFSFVFSLFLFAFVVDECLSLAYPTFAILPDWIDS